MMYETTRNWLEQYARLNGIDPAHLKLDGEPGMWEIFINFDSSADEIITLGDTHLVKEVVTWLGVQCRLEASINEGISGQEERIPWVVEAYPHSRFDGDSPIVSVRNDPDSPAETCCWNSGGDPAAGCDEIITGVDLLCNKHRAASAALMRNVEKEIV